MDVFKELTPAQIKVILEPNKSRIKDLLRLTFMDLLLKGVIAVRETEQITYKSKEVYRGKNFDVYRPKPHEILFISPFEESPDLTLTLYEMAGLVKNEIKSTENFRWDYLIEPELRKYFKPQSNIWLFRLFTGFKLNESGKILQADLGKFIVDYSTRIKGKRIEPEDVRELYKITGTNFLLIDGFDSFYLKNIFDEIEEEEKQKCKKNKVFTYDDTVIFYDSDENHKTFDFPSIPVLGGLILYQVLEQFEDVAESVSETFSSSFGSYDSTTSGWFGGDSGCGSDSSSGGDSGCSGCSGCGGCGGD